jgi:hypothetical protein
MTLLSWSSHTGSLISFYCSSQEVLCQIIGGLSPEPPKNATLISWQERIRKSYGFYIGVGLALLSCFLIGSSVILKKKGLIRLVATGATRAGRLLRAGRMGHRAAEPSTSHFSSQGLGLQPESRAPEGH